MSTKGYLSLLCRYVRHIYKSENFSVINAVFLDFHNDSNQQNINNEIEDFNIKKGERLTIVGSIPNEAFYNKCKFIAIGIWKTNSKYGNQLKLERINFLKPNNKSEITGFLTSGIIKGIGPVIAENIINAFGDKVFDIFDNNPELLLSVKGIGKNLKEKIISSWQSQKEYIRIISTLYSYGITVFTAKKIYKIYGQDTLEIINKNPYILTELRGISFTKADNIAQKIGISLYDNKRITAGILYIMQQTCYVEGNVYLPLDELLKRGEELLNIDIEDIEDNFENIEQLYIVNDKVYLKDLYHKEKYLNNIILKLGSIKVIFPENIIQYILTNNVLSSEQKEAIKKSLSTRCAVITGLPGVGKTFSIKTIVNTLEFFNKNFVLCAPTGKAAKRLSESTGREAKTIHRLLEAKILDGNVFFQKNENNPIKVDYIIVDEASMLDINLAFALFKACSDKTNVILVGDPNQLPSIGPGKLLMDIVDRYMCPVSKLEKIHRQASDSDIIRFAHAIYRGESVLFETGKDISFLEEESIENIISNIIEFINNYNIEHINDIQILSPMRRGPIGTNELNRILRNFMRKKIINELKLIHEDFEDYIDIDENLYGFALGDKVIQIENNYDKDVYNGEIGYVSAIDSEYGNVYVSFDGNKTIHYSDYEIDQIDFAYALTVHKFQGSESPVIIIPIVMQHYIMLYRNLIYTAVTRAKRKLILIGSRKAIDLAIQNNKSIQRYTTLGY